MSGFLTDLVPSKVAGYDAIVAFNPGLGHPNLKEGWSSTLELLKSLKLKSPSTEIITTCHSEYDMERDVKTLSEHFNGSDLEVIENPFCSRRADEDPLREGGIVNANSHIIIING